MNTQINLRLPEKMIVSASAYAEKHGYGTIQEFIKETVREKLFKEKTITKKEFVLVKKLLEISNKKKLYGSEEQLFAKLKGK